MTCLLALLAAPAWTPFLDPLPIDRYWLFLLLPLTILISVVYKTIRMDDLRRLPQQAAYLSVQIIVFMVLAAAALWLLTELV